MNSAANGDGALPDAVFVRDSNVQLTLLRMRANEVRDKAAKAAKTSASAVERCARTRSGHARKKASAFAGAFSSGNVVSGFQYGPPIGPPPMLKR